MKSVAIFAGSRVEETATSSHIKTSIGEFVSQQPDNDFMHVFESSCFNGEPIILDTENPGFVRVLLQSVDNVHTLIADSVVDYNGMHQIQSKAIKNNFIIRVELLQSTNMIPLLSDLYKIETVIVGPSVRLIYNPTKEDLIPSLIIGPEEGFEVETSENEIKNADVDFVPAIEIVGWPDQAIGWTTRQRNWPPPDLVEKVSAHGYHLVPKACTKETYEFEWRFSFSKTEGVLLRSIGVYSWCKQCYRIFKCMIKYHLSRPSVISTYHCKTLFLWTVEQYPPEEWTDKNLGQFFLLLIDKLIHALIQRRLPQYFIPKDNLFRNLEHDFASTIVNVLSNIRMRPFDYIYRRGIEPWDNVFQGMTIEEMLHWDEKTEEEIYSFKPAIKCDQDENELNATESEKYENKMNEEQGQKAENTEHQNSNSI